MAESYTCSLKQRRVIDRATHCHSALCTNSHELLNYLTIFPQPQKGFLKLGTRFEIELTRYSVCDGDAHLNLHVMGLGVRCMFVGYNLKCEFLVQYSPNDVYLSLSQKSLSEVGNCKEHCISTIASSVTLCSVFISASFQSLFESDISCIQRGKQTPFDSPAMEVNALQASVFETNAPETSYSLVNETTEQFETSNDTEIDNENSRLESRKDMDRSGAVDDTADTGISDYLDESVESLLSEALSESALSAGRSNLADESDVERLGVDIRDVTRGSVAESELSVDELVLDGSEQSGDDHVLDGTDSEDESMLNRYSLNAGVSADKVTRSVVVDKVSVMEIIEKYIYNQNNIIVMHISSSSTPIFDRPQHVRSSVSGIPKVFYL